MLFSFWFFLLCFMVFGFMLIDFAIWICFGLIILIWVWMFCLLCCGSAFLLVCASGCVWFWLFGYNFDVLRLRVVCFIVGWCLLFAWNVVLFYFWVYIVLVCLCRLLIKIYWFGCLFVVCLLAGGCSLLFCLVLGLEWWYYVVMFCLLNWLLFA